MLLLVQHFVSLSQAVHRYLQGRGYFIRRYRQRQDISLGKLRSTPRPLWYSSAAKILLDYPYRLSSPPIFPLPKLNLAYNSPTSPYLSKIASPVRTG